MITRTRRPRTLRILGTLLLVGLMTVAACAIAFAASPVKDAKYSGHPKGQSDTAVTFRVSASGKKVVGMRIKPYIPNKCGAGGPPPPQTSKPARIRKGEFTAKVVASIPQGSWRATVKGRFLAGGKEKGVIEFFPRPGEPAKCGGKVPYTTKAK